MMTKLLFALLLLPVLGYSQIDKKNVILYNSSVAFVKKENGIDALAEVRNSSDRYLKVKRFVDSNGGKIKNSAVSWALDFNGKSYFNLTHSVDLYQHMLFIPFDIIGKYCGVFISKESPSTIKNGGVDYGGGALGFLAKDSSKWGKGWIDKNGNKVWILFSDTDDVKKGIGGYEPSSLARFLSRSQLDELCEKHKIDLQDKRTKDLSFEEVVDIIHRINSGY